MNAPERLQPFRLPQGGRIDRRTPLGFSFNGEWMAGYAGDTLASALLANGRVFVARSYKYHRPRGIVAHGSEEPNALVTLRGDGGRTDPNTRSTVIELREGLDAVSQNHWPSLEFDIGAINDVFSPLLSAGFYNKTFMWPAPFWKKVYEPAIRAATGLGRAPEGRDPDRYQHRHAHCDVLIAGGGPAGLAAALAASAHGARVMLADEQSAWGGSLLHDPASEIDGKAAGAWVEDAIATLRARDGVTLLSRATVFGLFGHNHVGILERIPPAGNHDLPRERLWQVRAGQIVVAAGAHERPLVFDGNDRPGILLAESVRAYVNRYGVSPGHRVVVATCGDAAYTVARELHAAGVAVTLLVDTRAASRCPDPAPLRALGIEVLTGYTITGTEGRSRISALQVAPCENGRFRVSRRIACDAVAMHGGWTPAVHLHSQARGKLHFDDALDAFIPAGGIYGLRSAGAARGVYSLAECLIDGWSAGAAATGSTDARRFAVSPTAVGFVPVRVLPTDRDPSRVQAFVDFQNDVTAKDIGLALREGFESIEHVKRYTTTGMATDQGKTSNMNALGLVAERLGRPIPEIGTTTFRMPYTPVTFGALIGAHRGALFDPVRETPSHALAAAQDALFEDVGQWKRALAFPRQGEDLHAAVARECRAVRASGGVFDGSTLGKIEVVGRDALEFLNRMYVNSFDKLAPGRCRYALMLREDGHIYDDGIVAKLAPDRFHVTTTTGGAARVLAFMEDYLQTEWSELQVYLTSVTEQYAVIAVQGPQARTLIAPLVEGIDVSDAAMPHMSVRIGRFAGVPCRLFRVSFTGEIGFEINVPWGYGAALWTLLCERGAGMGFAPYGTESMHVLRAERGYIIVGQETDGTVTPDDLGLAGMIGKSKRDFVGKRSLARPDLVARGRKQLVGLLTDDPALVLEEGAQIVDDPLQAVPMTMLGHVTSSYASANCGRSIALALVKGGRERVGQTLHATTADGFASVKVVPPVFLDPEGRGVHG
ncbi:MAG: sarcosine oxidase subunit alpha family protein [Betaproteobacteria bacterium]|nr:sarcosine oxidase subunit alpha family protein [Betaproteobacteria bacterium]